MVNEILLRRKNLIYLESNVSSAANSKQYVASILKNVENIGFTFSKNLILKLCKMTINELDLFYKDLLPILKKMVGAHVVHRPMYKNFPSHLMDMSEVDLYFNAIFHYLTLQNLNDLVEEKERLPLIQNTNLNILDLGTKNDLISLCVNIVSSSTSTSEQDKLDVSDIVTNNLKEVLCVKDLNIPHKENLCFFTGLLLKNVSRNDVTKQKKLKNILKKFNNATDILRLAVSLSNGDVSLSDDSKFKLSRPYRRILIEMISDISFRNDNFIHDMFRYREKWLRFGEYVHPRTYDNAIVTKLFDELRNNSKFRTKASILENLLENKNVVDSVNILKNTPGEFARKLDRLLRMTSKRKEIEEILSGFESVVDSVSTNVLLQVKNHFENRDSGKRTFMPKGTATKIYVIDNDLESIKKVHINKLIFICENALIKRFSSLDNMGNVYIDDKLSNIYVPSSQRSASKSLKTVTRGSRFKLDDNTNQLRFFIWWKNINDAYGYESRVDIDISASLISEDYTSVDDIYYGNFYRGVDSYATFSGDITDAPNGASEFIDLNLNKVPSKFRYVLMSIRSYTGQKFSELPECFGGWMELENSKRGKIFEPKLVKNKIDVTVENTTSYPLLIDLKTREVVWLDMSSSTYGINNAASDGKVFKYLDYILNSKKTSIYDLMSMHVKGRGKIVKSEKNADLIITSDLNRSGNNIINPTDLEIIASKFMV